MSESSTPYTCGCVVYGYPSWAFSLTLRGWSLEVIFIKENSWLDAATKWFPRIKVILLDTKLIMSEELLKINYWFCEIDPPRVLSLWLSEAKFVVTSRRARHVQGPAWRMHPISLSHVNVGGITDGRWDFFFYSNQSDQLLSDADAPVTFRDLSSVLDSQAYGTPVPPPATALLHSSRPQVLQLRPNTFHGRGLIPWVSRSFFVIAPSIYSPTKWVRRRCSNLEMSRIFDIPEFVLQSLSKSQTQGLLTDVSVLPQKPLLRILDLFSLSHPTPPGTKLLGMNLNLEGTREDSTFSHNVNSSCISSTSTTTASKEQDTQVRNAKAAKNDDAPIPEYLWDDAIVLDGDPTKISALTAIRTFALRWWKRHTTRDFIKWLSKIRHDPGQTEDLPRNLQAGCDCIRRCANSSWWDWDSGSRPLFWRWPSEYQKIIRDGLPPWIKGPMPRCLVPQRSERDPIVRKVITSKLSKVREKNYLVPGEVRSLTSFFTVPKGDGDVRMVYDATKSGLNAQIWAPWFLLPTIDSHLRCVSPGFFMGDIDLSEQFLNFMLHEKLQPYAGVDLTTFLPHELSEHKRVIWERWGRCGMGFVSSPYTAIQAALFAEEVMRGNPTDPDNVFKWDDVSLNLPGGLNYKPWDPWVSKVRYQGDNATMVIANDLKIYVDDVRTIGSTYNDCRRASRVVASTLSYLGIQDAPRKRRDPSQTPGPWAGSIVHSEGNSITVCISQERWAKAKMILSWITESCESGDSIEFKMLESYRCYLIYIGRTYPAIVPYLKGIHLTLDSWRPWRAEDSWKMSMSEIRMALQTQGHETSCFNLSSKPPPKVKIASRLHDDIKALNSLFLAESPPKRCVRPDTSTVATYMFGDASGSGFGSSLFVNDKLHYLHGKWTVVMSQESSNYRELANLINAIKDAFDKHLLLNTELFVFTDNFAAESTFHKGTSASKKLFELMLTLRQLQMNGGFAMHMVHVSGLRIMSQGTDGLSRGMTDVGIMNGSSMLSYIPLHLDAFERQGSSLKLWVTSWFQGKSEPCFLSPRDWYASGHTHSTCVWSPPPAAADAALEQLAFGIHKRPYSSHLVLIPRLMTARWRKLLGKICCLIFTVPLGSEI